MNCRDVEELGGAWLDGELDLVRSVELQNHTRECAACAARIRRDETLRDAVRSAPYYRAPDGLRERVIRQWTPELQRQWHWLPTLVATAAVAGAVLLFLRPPAPAIQQEVVEAHVRSLLANHLLDVPSTDRHTVKPWFAGKLDYSPDVETPQGFELLGGRLDYLDGRPVAALVYRRRQHIINVFVWPDGERDRRPSVRTERGYQVAHWTGSGTTWWAVSDLNGPELMALATEPATSTSPEIK